MDPKNEYLGAWKAILAFHSSIVAKIEAELHSQNCIPLAWYDVLIELDSEKGLNQNQIVERRILTKSGISRTVDTLERNGLVLRKKDTNDKRAKLVYITERGKLAIKRAWPIYRTTIERYFKLKKEDYMMLEAIFLGLRRKLNANLIH